MRWYHFTVSILSVLGLLSSCAMTSGKVNDSVSEPTEPVRPTIELNLKPDMIGAAENSQITMTLTVTWTGSTPWDGTSPSSRIYDFIVTRKGEEVWRWSADQMFAQAITPVTIPANGVLNFSEAWMVNAGSIDSGSYTVTGHFIPAQIEASQTLTVTGTN